MYIHIHLLRAKFFRGSKPHVYKCSYTSLVTCLFIRSGRVSVSLGRTYAGICSNRYCIYRNILEYIYSYTHIEIDPYFHEYLCRNTCILSRYTYREQWQFSSNHCSIYKRIRVYVFIHRN
jgi:hypothetical protein